MKKRLLLIYILLLLVLVGCWDRREPEENAIVTGIGFDYNPETDKYKLITQMVNPLTPYGGGEGSLADKPNFWTVSAWGYTTLDALSNIRKKVSRYLHYSHTNLFIISEDLLNEKGVMPIIDVLERSRQSRPILLFAVTRDDPEQILNIDFPIEALSSEGLRNMLELTDQEIGTSILQNAKVFINKLTREGIEPVAILVDLLEDEENQTDNEQEHSDDHPPVKVEGLVAFKGDNLAGFLTGRETRGWNWIRGKINRATLTVKSPEKEDELLSVVTNLHHAEYKPVVSDGQAKIEIKIIAGGVIQGVMGRAQFSKESELSVSLKKRIAEVIRNDIEMAIDKAQELETDIFGFGNSFYRLENEQWQEMEEQWDQIFSELLVEIDVEISFIRTGMINRSLEIR